MFGFEDTFISIRGFLGVQVRNSLVLSPFFPFPFEKKKS